MPVLGRQRYAGTKRNHHHYSCDSCFGRILVSCERKTYSGAGNGCADSGCGNTLCKISDDIQSFVHTLFLYLSCTNDYCADYIVFDLFNDFFIPVGAKVKVREEHYER